MSNAKRRHRRRWYRAQRTARAALIEADLQRRGYTLSGSTGAERVWRREVNGAELRERYPYLPWTSALPAFVMETEWVEVP